MDDRDEARSGAPGGPGGGAEWPPYAFVPGGPWPHPATAPGGLTRGQVDPIDPEAWERSPAYLRGAALFNAGYYWEAHEAWEALWHAHGRAGPTADLVKGLIKLAAAGVKVREGQPHGVATHARRAADLFARVRALLGPHALGLDLDALAAFARETAARPPTDPGPRGARVTRVFAFRIEPRRP